MILCIGTNSENLICLSLIKNKKELIKKNIKLNRLQCERMLIEVEKLLKESNLRLKDIKSIKVDNENGTFTGIRSAVVIANALAYILNIQVRNKQNEQELNKGFNIIKPRYSREPNIN